MPELLDLYDQNRQRCGRMIVRGERVPEGCRLLLVSVMTVNSSGEILVTRRAPEKKYAGRWEVTGGCVQAGESAEQGALRELREETGICAVPAELQHCGSAERAGYIHEFFLVHKDVPLEEIRLQRGETDDACWVSPQRFLRMAESHLTIPHHNVMIFMHYADVFRDCKMQRGHI